MTKLQTQSPRYADNDVRDYDYETSIYDNPNLNILQHRLTLFKKLSEQFECFDGEIYDSQTGKLKEKDEAKYKTASSVREALKSMGLK